MCFSATASFGAAVVLGTVGIVAMSKAGTRPRRLLAAIPLIFSVQQCMEGLIWLSFDQAGLAAWQSFFTTVYLVFAMAIWPFWIPYTVWKMEKDHRRKKLIGRFLWVGCFVMIGVCTILVIYPVQPVATHHHLHYAFDLSPLVRKLITAFTVLYILATIVTPFLSGITKMKWLGVVFLVAYFFAVIFFNGFVISVWCFFAAMLSFVVLWILSGSDKPLRYG